MTTNTEAVKFIMEECTEAKKITTSSMNSYILYNIDLIPYKKHISRPCFGDLRLPDPGCRWLAVWNGRYAYSSYSNFYLTEEEKFKFLYFLIKESVFSKHIDYNDVEWCAAKDTLILDGDLPSNLVIFLAQLARLTTAFPDVVRSVLFLKKEFSFERALYLGMFFPTFEEEVSLKNLVFASPRDEHLPINYNFIDKESVKNFLHNTPYHVNAPLVEKLDYRGVDLMWGNPDNGILKNIVTKTTPRNVFQRPKPIINPIKKWIEINDLGDLFYE